MSNDSRKEKNFASAWVLGENANPVMHWPNLFFCSGMTLKGSLVQKIGNAIKEVARNKGSTWWYTPHMAAASRAITERIPLVDILLEVRDARVCINPSLHGSFPLNCWPVYV